MKYIIFLLIINFCFASLVHSQKNVNSKDFSKEKTITKIILVRHAEKEKDGTKNPALSIEGEERAKKLAFMLNDFSIDRLYATPYLRTQKTLGVISDEKKIEITNYDARDVEFAKNIVKKEQGKTIVIAGHSNTIPALVNQFIGSYKYKELSEEEYGKLWIITFVNNELVDCSLFNY